MRILGGSEREYLVTLTIAGFDEEERGPIVHAKHPNFSPIVGAYQMLYNFQAVVRFVKGHGLHPSLQLQVQDSDSVSQVWLVAGYPQYGQISGFGGKRLAMKTPKTAANTAITSIATGNNQKKGPTTIRFPGGFWSRIPRQRDPWSH